jgi:hypothetical protein
MKKHQDDHELENVQLLEERLRSTYGPVKPAPEFIETLQHRLITPPRVLMENRRNGLVFLVLVIGLVVGIILFVLIRAIYNLFALDEPAD